MPRRRKEKGGEEDWENKNKNPSPAQIFSGRVETADDIVHLEELFLIRSKDISPATSNADSTWSLCSGENHIFQIKIHSGLTVLFTTFAVVQQFVLSFF